MALTRTEATEFAITDKDGDTVVTVSIEGTDVGFWKAWPHSTHLSLPVEHIDDAIEALQLLKARTTLKAQLVGSLELAESV